MIDDYNRECLTIRCAVCIPSERVTRILDEIIEQFGYPAAIRVDNGPEFIAVHFQEWAKESGIQIIYIQPGRPSQNGYIERFNRTYREDVLDAYLFEDIQQLQMITEHWVKKYNTKHPHQSMGRMGPVKFKNSRRKVIDAYESVKAKLNGSFQEPALTDSPPSMGWPLCEILNG